MLTSLRLAAALSKRSSSVLTPIGGEEGLRSQGAGLDLLEVRPSASLPGLPCDATQLQPAPLEA